jgi:hypothetical protein
MAWMIPIALFHLCYRRQRRFWSIWKLCAPSQLCDSAPRECPLRETQREDGTPMDDTCRSNTDLLSLFIKLSYKSVKIMKWRIREKFWFRESYLRSNRSKQNRWLNWIVTCILQRSIYKHVLQGRVAGSAIRPSNQYM